MFGDEWRKCGNPRLPWLHLGSDSPMARYLARLLSLLVPAYLVQQSRLVTPAPGGGRSRSDGQHQVPT